MPGLVCFVLGLILVHVCVYVSIYSYTQLHMLMYIGHTCIIMYTTGLRRNGC